MTLALWTLAAAVLTAVVLLIVRHVHTSRRRQEVWICMDCMTGFSNETAARHHLALHRR